MTAEDYDELLASYDRVLDAGDNGNPTPVDAMALVFMNGRAVVCVRVCGRRWVEVMSAPVTSADGLMCGVDGRKPEAFVTVDGGIATGFRSA